MSTRLQKIFEKKQSAPIIEFKTPLKNKLLQQIKYNNKIIENNNTAKISNKNVCVTSTDNENIVAENNMPLTSYVSNQSLLMPYYRGQLNSS